VEQPKLLEADLTEDEIEVIRELSAYAIESKQFDSDPIRCVINAYLTHLMSLHAQEEETNGTLH
jgi:hypothetical protein